MQDVQSRVSQTGAQILLDSLEKAGVQVLFGYPGGAVIPMYDALYDNLNGIEHILVRHEQAAAHAAEGYAKATGKPGVVLVTSGPGATNTVTGIADAYSDSVPLIVISGQVGTHGIGTNAFQELDMLSITSSITKMSYQVHHVDELPSIVAEAYQVATSGRPGPVLIDLPKDITLESGVSGTLPSQSARKINLTEPALNLTKIQELVEGLSRAKQPVIIAGAGVLKANAQGLLRQLVNQYHIPVVSTLLGLGAMTSDNPFFLGMAGMHGSVLANTALDQADFILNIGSRFDDRVVTNAKDFSRHATIAHIDIDITEIGRVLETTYQIHADAYEALSAILKFSEFKKMAITKDWQSKNQQQPNQPIFDYPETDQAIMPQTVIENIGQLTKGKALIVTDVGQHQMSVAQHYPFQDNHQLSTSGGLGTMGYGIPAAIGAKIAKPDREVVLFVGDGGFQMTSEELAILNDNNLNIKIVMLNNHSLGMVRQWQTLFFNQRLSQTVFDTQPNFGKLASAYGINYMLLDQPDSLTDDLQRAFASEKSILIEVIIPEDAQVLPMINAGAPYRDMITWGENK